MTYLFPFPTKPLLVMVDAQRPAFLRFAAFFACQFWKCTLSAFWRFAIAPLPIHHLAATHTRNRCFLIPPLSVMLSTKTPRKVWFAANPAFTAREVYARVLTNGAKMKVYNSVIATVAVFVMAYLVWFQWPTQMPTHHKAMFQNPPVRESVGMLWFKEIHIPIRFNHSTLGIPPLPFDMAHGCSLWMERR
jgi:hypothetical protein